MTDAVRPAVQRTTDEVAPAERLDFWQHLASELFFDLRPEPLGGQTIRASVGRRSELELISLDRVYTSPQRVERSPDQVRRSPMDGYFLNLHIWGKGCVRQAGREAVMLPGDLVFVHGGLPFEFYFPVGTVQFGLRLPADILPSSRISKAGQKVSGDRILARMLGSAMRITYERREPLDAREASAVTEHLLDLVERICHVEMARGVVACSSADHLLELIVRNASDPDLSVDWVAAQLATSTRSIQRHMRAMQTTFSGFLREQRVLHCRRALRDPAQAHRSIAEIAFDAGFSDLSTFYRAFRRLTGQTAGEYRARA